MPDVYETCLEHGGVAELFWGLLMAEGESGLRWCPEGHMSPIAYLHWRFVLSILDIVH